MSENMELVRSVVADWGRGHWADVTWAGPALEFQIADGPDQTVFVGVEAMIGAWREFLGAWSDYATTAEEYRDLADGRVLVVLRVSGRGKASGVDLSAGGQRGAVVFEFCDGVVTRLSIYFEHRNALRDLGLED